MHRTGSHGIVLLCSETSPVTLSSHASAFSERVIFVTLKILTEPAEPMYKTVLFSGHE